MRVAKARELNMTNWTSLITLFRLKTYIELEQL